MTNLVWNTEGDLLLKLYQVYLVRMKLILTFDEMHLYNDPLLELTRRKNKL